MPFPSDEQLQVIIHRGSPMVVVAGPGTGKTKAIVERMIRLLNEDQRRNIAFVTFTRTSRSDTRRKLDREVQGFLTENPQFSIPRVGTLHANARSILHALSYSIGYEPNFTILISEKDERHLLVGDVIEDLGLDFQAPFVERAVLHFLRNLEPSTEIDINIDLQYRIFEHYQSILRFYDALGMEEIVFLACRALESNPDNIPQIFLQVDEYQDLNQADQHYVNLIVSNDESQVVVVGDDAQSIYGFREANYRGLRTLWESSEWTPVHFPDSFRLPAHIQRAALALISDQEYLGSMMNIKPDNGRLVQVYQCTRSEYQATVVARKIREFMENNTNQDDDPLHYSDIMILCPSASFIPSVIEELEREEIPSKHVSKPHIPEDVWQIILVIRMVFHQDNVAFRQWMDIVGFSNEEVSEIRHNAMRSGLDLIAFCQTVEDERIQSILRSFRDVRDAYGDIETLIRAVANFPWLRSSEGLIREVLQSVTVEGELPTAGQLLSVLYGRYGILEDEATLGEEDSVLISTFHSSKGLEGELVCLMWMNERFMPMPGRDTEEERRLLYVGMTRAKQELVITFHEIYTPQTGYHRRAAMSPFLHGIVNHLSFTRVRARDIQ